MVEGNSLENCRAGNGTEGSNPSPSAKLKKSAKKADIFSLMKGFERECLRHSAALARRPWEPSYCSESIFLSCSKVESYCFCAKTAAFTVLAPACCRTFAEASKVAPVVKISSISSTSVPFSISCLDW